MDVRLCQNRRSSASKWASIGDRQSIIDADSERMEAVHELYSGSKWAVSLANFLTSVFGKNCHSKQGISNWVFIKKRSSVPIMFDLDSILENTNFDKDQNSFQKNGNCSREWRSFNIQAENSPARKITDQATRAT